MALQFHLLNVGLNITEIPTKISTSTTVFNIDDNKMFL